MNLRVFSLELLAHCPLTAHCTPDLLEKAYAHWIGYKKRIPVRGAILLNEAMDSVLLVRGWKSGASWMFPRGKINEHEDDLDCAVREVNEETGFNAKIAGLIPTDRRLKSFEMTMKDQNVKLFVIPNVPMDFPFEPKTRKEIGDIRWYKLADLPGRTKRKQGQDNAQAATNASKFYNIASFLDQLNRWIKHQRKTGGRNRTNHRNGHLSQQEVEDLMTEEEGMTTEAVPEPPTAYTTEESHEAATRELHKLLKIQPPSQLSQAGTYGFQQDKGKALLAMLQQKQDNSQPLQPAQPVVQTNTHALHTPMDHIHNVAPRPATPQHHQTMQRLPQGSHPVPPPFQMQSAQPDINNQLLSVLGISKPGSEKTRWQETPAQNHQATLQQQHAINYQQTWNHQQALNEQQAMALASAATANRPHLAHPQPLPPQANHILAGPVPLHSAPDNRSVQMQQQSNLSGPFAGGMNLPQQLVANLPQPPAVLDDKRRALLSAFTKDLSPAQGLTSKSPPSPTADGRRSNQHQQPFKPDVLGSPYSGEHRTNLSAQNGTQSTGVPHVSPHLAMAQAALRPSNVSQTQQKALLDIFKTSSSISPRIEKVQADRKENGAPGSSHQRIGHQQPSNFHSGLATPPMMVRANNAPVQENNLHNLPHGAQGLAVRSRNMERIAPQQQSYSQAAQPLSAFNADGASSESRAQTLSNPRGITLNPTVAGSTYNNPVSPAQIGLQTPLIPRQQESTPQQRQALMSLFGKTAATVSASASASPAAQSQGKEPVLFTMAQLPTPVSRGVSTEISLGIDGFSGARIGSQQAPISPENEKFLLNYLKTVSDSAE